MSRNITDELEADIKEFADNATDLDRQSRLEGLRKLFIKHMKLQDDEILFEYQNVFNVSNTCVNSFINQSGRVHISEIQLSEHEKRSLAFMEATIGELRRLKILNKNIKFNFKE